MNIRVNGLDTYVARLVVNATAPLLGRIQAWEATAATAADVALLRGRVETLEAERELHLTRIQDLEGQIANNNGDNDR